MGDLYILIREESLETCKTEAKGISQVAPGAHAKIMHLSTKTEAAKKTNMSRRM